MLLLQVSVHISTICTFLKFDFVSQVAGNAHKNNGRSICCDLFDRSIRCATYWLYVLSVQSKWSKSAPLKCQKRLCTLCLWRWTSGDIIMWLLPCTREKFHYKNALLLLLLCVCACVCVFLGVYSRCLVSVCRCQHDRGRRISPPR